MPRYKVIILDFDGVIVESNTIKNKAFEALFSDYPEHLKTIVEYHKRTNCIRFTKFKHIYEEILKLPYTSQVEERLGKAFSQYCIKAVIACPWVKGASEFLEFFKNQVPMYVVSINPPEDLSAILSGRRLMAYFKDVYTVKAGKTDAIKDILLKVNLPANQAVFIGDSLGDMDSASKAGVDFIGRRAEHDFPKGDFPVFKDMAEILLYLRDKT